MNNIDYIIFKILSNEATLEDKELFDIWLNADISNYSEFTKLKSYWKSHVVFQHEINVDESFDRFRQNKLKTVSVTKKRMKQLFISVLSAAAVALLFFTIGLPVKTTKDHFTYISKGQKETIYLPDSTKIILNKNSRVNYSSQYNKTERRIQLTGEAFFDVRKNKKVPFVVQMEKCQITVLGTAFNIRAYTTESSIRATLIRGVIRFDVNDNGNEITLKPNQELKYNKQTKDINIKDVNAESSLIWMTMLHRYHSKTLETFLNDMGIIYNKQINIHDKELANTIISGSFSNDQSLDEILKFISRSVPIKWEICKDTIKITHY